MNRTAVYPGTFDPITNGHIDIMQRASSLYDNVYLAVAPNRDKNPLFTLAERLSMAKKAAQPFTNVTVETFEGLVVKYVRKKKARVVIRGLRMISDFEYEFQMALTNRKMAGDVETMFMMPHESYSYLSSKLIKEVAVLGADISAFVPGFVADGLKRKLKRI